MYLKYRYDSPTSFAESFSFAALNGHFQSTHRHTPHTPHTLNTSPPTHHRPTHYPRTRMPSTTRNSSFRLFLRQKKIHPRGIRSQKVTIYLVFPENKGMSAWGETVHVRKTDTKPRTYTTGWQTPHFHLLLRFFLRNFMSKNLEKLSKKLECNSFYQCNSSKSKDTS